MKIKELTFSSIFLGVLIGIVMTAANVYLGLYAGMTVSASIPAAVIAMGVYKGVLRRAALHESNIVQTMASAGESLAAGIIFTLPALVIVGAWNEFEFWPTTLIAMSGGLLGVIFMIPLRETLIGNKEKLIYPEGIACASVLRAAEAQADSGDPKAGFKAILSGLFFGGAFKFLSSGLKVFVGTFEKAKIFSSSTIFLGIDISPALLAVGYIVKLEVAVLVLLGGLIGFNIAIPMLGVPVGMEDLPALDLAWTLWSTQVRYLGVGAMIVGGLWSIVGVRQGIVDGLGSLKSNVGNKKAQVDLGVMPLMFILLFCFAIMLYLYNSLIGVFGLSLITTVLMIFLSFVLVAVSSYIVGLVGSSNNPVSGMTISALLITGALFLVLGFEGESAVLSTLGVAAVVCCAACTAGDCSQDLKTGSIIGATPKSQQIAQLIGVTVPAFVIAPVLTLLHHAYVIGEGLKAPQAALFASITEALFGKGELPYDMVIYGAFLGVVILALDFIFFRNKKFKLHLMPIAVGIYLPITLATPMIIGAILRYLRERRLGDSHETNDKGVLISSGLIAGEALMGVIVAIFLYLNIDMVVHDMGVTIKENLSLIAFFFIATFLLRKALNK